MLFGHLAVIEIAFSSHRVEHSRCRLPEMGASQIKNKNSSQKRTFYDFSLSLSLSLSGVGNSNEETQGEKFDV